MSTVFSAEGELQLMHELVTKLGWVVDKELGGGSQQETTYKHSFHPEHELSLALDGNQCHVRLGEFHQYTDHGYEAPHALHDLTEYLEKFHADDPRIYAVPENLGEAHDKLMNMFGCEEGCSYDSAKRIIHGAAHTRDELNEALTEWKNMTEAQKDMFFGEEPEANTELPETPALSLLMSRIY